MFSHTGNIHPGGANSGGRANFINSDGNVKMERFPYHILLPYKAPKDEANVALNEIIKQLYISIKAEDIEHGAVCWTKKLEKWLNLKFQLTLEQRSELIKLYYMLCLAPGIDAECFGTMLQTLAGKIHLIRPAEDLILDWRPLWKEIRRISLPDEVPFGQHYRARDHKHIISLCNCIYRYFDPEQIQPLLDEILQYYTTSEISGAFTVVGSLNLLIPTRPAPPGCLQAQDYLPCLFYLWSHIARSRQADLYFLDIFSRLARDSLPHEHVEFCQFGVFTKDQSDLIFTAMLRLMEIPVGQVGSPYSESIDKQSYLGAYLEKDESEHPVEDALARWIIMSLSHTCLDVTDSILSSLKDFVHCIDTFFHPSNDGTWTIKLASFVWHLANWFVFRWNQEQSGSLDIPQSRRLTDELKVRFVKILKDPMFMGLFSKQEEALHYSIRALQELSYLEPYLILPGALQRFYPSLTGLVEVHRAQSSLYGLNVVTNIIAQHKGLRCQLVALLALALPGIDPNDLSKTEASLDFIASAAYSVPFADLSKSHNDDSFIATRWVQCEMDRLGREGPNVLIDYRTELSDEDEVTIARSSTAGFEGFVIRFCDKLFSLLKNLPRAGSAESNLSVALRDRLPPIFSALSPEILNRALENISSFVTNNIEHQARNATAYLCNALCRANPIKTLAKFVPLLIAGIQHEINDNNAACDRSSGSVELPRDRALVWYISMLNAVVCPAGDSLVSYRKDLFDIAVYMQEKCRGIPTEYISRYVQCLLISFTSIYPVDSGMYEPVVFERGIDISDWAKYTKPSDLTIRWHVPSLEEISSAVELFMSQTDIAMQQLVRLTSHSPPVKKDGKSKEWSDEIVRTLSHLQGIIFGNTLQL